MENPKVEEATNTMLYLQRQDALVRKDYFDDLYRSLKWLRKNIGNNEARPVLNGIHKKDGVLTATTGYHLCAMKLNLVEDRDVPGFGEWVNWVIPDGLWAVRLLNQDFIILENMGDENLKNYPDLYKVIGGFQGMKSLPEDKSKTKYKTLAAILQPGLLKLVLGSSMFDRCQLVFGHGVTCLELNCSDHVDPDTEYHAFIMGMHSDNVPGSAIVDAENFKSDIYPAPAKELE
jgi:hypothetical protein